MPGRGKLVVCCNREEWEYRTLYKPSWLVIMYDYEWMRSTCVLDIYPCSPRTSCNLRLIRTICYTFPSRQDIGSDQVTLFKDSEQTPRHSGRQNREPLLSL